MTKITTKKISELVPDDKNFNKGSEYGNSLIEKSFEKFGAGRSILIDKNNKIIAGNKSTENYSSNGGEDIIIVESDGTKLIAVKRTDIDLDTPQGREMALADNATAKANIVWAEDVIASELGVEVGESWGVDMGKEIPEAEEDNYEIPDTIETDIVLGDLFEIGEHRLLCGDSTDSEAVARLMNGILADMCHTDPPYNINYEGGSKKREKIANDKLDDFPKFLYDVYTTISTALKKGGAIYVWHASTETHNFIQQFLDAGFLFKSYIVWNKNNSTFGRSDYHWKHEPCIYGWLDGASHKWYGDRKQTTVWDVDRPSRSEEHPTMKPIDLCSKALINSSTINDIVLDVFLGSGSTMVASHQLNRKCYGMELDPKYCQVIIDRMLKLDPTLKILKNGEPI